MKFKLLIVFILLLSFVQNSNSENNKDHVELPSLEEIFYIGKMDSHNNDFVLFFKTREKAILARGEEFNYITDYPQDLYLYDRRTKKTEPLITYEWFPKIAKFYLSNYDFPVFPEDFAYYLMKDNKTLILVSAVKNINQNLKFDITTKKLDKYQTKGKLDFIVSSIGKNCGFKSMDDNYKCNYYKPLISQNLIN
tara:strand:+ start:333 stop:914 length:582 start_codon:yes stop_codon:yes gene_type:complete